MNLRVFLQTMIALASAALGEGGGLVGLYVCAVLATGIAVVVMVALERAASRVGGEAVIVREAEG